MTNDKKICSFLGHLYSKLKKKKSTFFTESSPRTPKVMLNYLHFKYSPFHKTLPKSSSQIHWIPVRFYEMDDI